MKKAPVFLALLFSLLILPLHSACSCRAGVTHRTTYTIDCVLSDDYILTAKQTVDFFNDTENSINELKFNLFGNAFRKGAVYSPISAQYISNAYPNGVNYGEMIVEKVYSSTADLPFSICGQDENILSVQLPGEVFPDERYTLTIEYTLKLADIIARTGYNKDTINLADFYPILCAYDQANGFYECLYYSCGDPFYSQVADYRVSLTVGSKFVVASAGELVKAKTDGDVQTLDYKLENARSFSMVLSENFECVTDTSTGVRINYYYYNDDKPKDSLDYAVKSMNYFNQTFGEYPYKTYNVVQTKFVQGGMEYPTLVMISDDLESRSFGEVIVHETAHQWWQTTVGNNQIEYGFLDEGLAEYSVVLFYENHPEYSMTRESMVKSAENTYKVFCSVYDKLFGTVDTTMLRSLGEYTSEYEYVNIAYVKSCIMYDYLRLSVGDDLFFKGLKRYYGDCKFKIATPSDLVGAYERVGASANGFFQSFFDGKVII